MKIIVVTISLLHYNQIIMNRMYYFKKSYLHVGQLLDLGPFGNELFILL